jgi:GT2 family glycosyltransferase
MQDAAIVILNFNGRKTLEKFLPSVLQCSIFPVIVADNCSNDDSLAYLKKFKEINTIGLSENFGFAEGYNKALAALQGKYKHYILLNSDVEVTEGWDKALIDFLCYNLQYTAVQPKIRSYLNKEFFEHAGAAGGFLDALGFPFCRGRIFDSIEADSGQYDDQVDVDWVSGACMAVKADDFHGFGGFDPVFFAHMEEIDLCWRWRSAGKRLAYISDSVVYHLGGGTLPMDSPKKNYLNFRNNLLMLYKNLSDQHFKKVYRWRILLDTAAMLKVATSGNAETAKAVLKAHRDFRKLIRNYKRNGLAPKLPNHPKNHRVWSIVIEHFLKKKINYSDL